MLAAIDWTQVATTAAATLGLVAVSYGGIRSALAFRANGNGKAAPAPLPPAIDLPSSPCPDHTDRIARNAERVGTNCERLSNLEEDRRQVWVSDQRQWDMITEQGKALASTAAELKALGAGVEKVDKKLDRLVEKLLD